MIPVHSFHSCLPAGLYRGLMAACFAIFLACAPDLSLAETAANLRESHRPQPWTPADIVSQETASSFRFSPDGSALVWVKSRNSKEKDRNVTDLYLTRLDLARPAATGSDKDDFVTIRLTRSDESESEPYFSPNGLLLYFLSSRDEGKKLWAMNLLGGEPYSVFEFEERIRQLRQLEDGRFIFLSGEGDLLLEAVRKERKDNTQVIEDTTTFKPTRLFSFDPESRQVRRLTHNRFPIQSYAVSDDGRYAVTSHILSTHYGADAQPPPAYYLNDLETGSRIRILQGYQTPGNFSFTREGNGIYFTAVTSSDPQWSGAGISELYFISLPPNSAFLSEENADRYLQVNRVPLDWDWGLASEFEVIGNDVLVSLADGPLRRLAFYERTGSAQWRKKPVDTGKYSGRVALAAVSRDFEQIAFVYSTASTLPQYRLGQWEVRRREARITNTETLFLLNEKLGERHLAQSEIFRWNGAGGHPVNGILYYPKNYDPVKRYPLVVAIRGGPAAVTLDWWNMNWAYFPHLFSEKEAFVLMPNYHGSSNHGLDFVESIKGRYYELELMDILAAIDTLDAAGKIDRNAMGVTGWSNGSILATALSVEYPDLFRVVGAGAGTINWTSDYGTCEFGVRFDQSYLGGAPWDSTDGTFYNRTYIEKSPLFRMERVRAPTIIFFGSEDRAVPRDQGWEHYRALQQIGQAPVRFLWFPDQPHSLQKLTHQERKITEEIAWFERFLFDSFEEPNAAFKKESPLAELLKRDSLARDNGYFGILNQNKLIPEVVSMGKDTLSIGRFPVTNMQYYAFDSTHTFHPLHANYPVVGVSVEQAQSFTRWLSEYTGQTYRLPDQREARALHQTAQRSGPGQNTLNYLSGFPLTMDEVALLRQKASLLSPMQLIRESGRFAPVKIGTAEIYDLGGNVAEWVAPANAKDDGQRSDANKDIWQIYGYSAMHFADPRDPGPPEWIPGYTGFRVIRE